MDATLPQMWVSSAFLAALIIIIDRPRRFISGCTSGLDIRDEPSRDSGRRYHRRLSQQEATDDRFPLLFGNSAFVCFLGFLGTAQRSKLTEAAISDFSETIVESARLAEAKEEGRKEVKARPSQAKQRQARPDGSGDVVRWCFAVA